MIEKFGYKNALIDKSVAFMKSYETIMIYERNDTIFMRYSPSVTTSKQITQYIQVLRKSGNFSRAEIIAHLRDRIKKGNYFAMSFNMDKSEYSVINKFEFDENQYC